MTYKPIIIATHPRSGTHLTIDLFRKQFKECQSWLWWGETIHHAYCNLDHLDPNYRRSITQQKAESLLKRCDRPICKTHSLPEFKELGQENQDFLENLLEKADVYYVARDGRSVLCSSHLWQQNFNPSARCSFSEYIRQTENGMSRAKYWANHVQSWLNNPKVKLLTFENNVKNTAEVLAQVGKDLGLQPLYKEPLLPRKRKIGNRWEDYWLRIIRDFESTTIVGRYKSQTPKKWQENFSQEDKIFFHQEAGEMLIKLGYEKSEQWLN